MIDQNKLDRIKELFNRLSSSNNNQNIASRGGNQYAGVNNGFSTKDYYGNSIELPLGNNSQFKYQEKNEIPHPYEIPYNYKLKPDQTLEKNNTDYSKIEKYDEKMSKYEDPRYAKHAFQNVNWKRNEDGTFEAEPGDVIGDYGRLTSNDWGKLAMSLGDIAANVYYKSKKLI